MKLMSVKILFILIFTISCFISENGIAQTNETNIELKIPEGHALITNYISEDGKTWGYLYGKLKENPKYGYDRYTEYYLSTHNDNVIGPLTYKHKSSKPDDKEMFFWAIDCELYITANGSYVVLDLVDGGWTTVYNGVLLNYDLKKPEVIVQNDKVVIHCFEWRQSALKRYELE
tara:strand:- start:1920 stop:2441 length:522 start_codon:yes stop_codon:yes gene_type:complete